MFKGSIYGGFFTVSIVIALVTFGGLKFQEMSNGSNDISKQLKKFNDFEHDHMREIEMKNYNFMPSVAIRTSSSKMSKQLMDLYESQTESRSSVKFNIEKLEQYIVFALSMR